MTPATPYHSLTRTVNPDGSHTLDAIDADGRAWWLIVGNDDAPEGWTELLPLPGHVPGAEPDDLALRVQRLEAMRETEKAAVLDLYQQIDRLKRRQDWQYTKIGRLEDFTIKDLAAAAHAMANEMEAQP